MGLGGSNLLDGPGGAPGSDRAFTAHPEVREAARGENRAERKGGHEDNTIGDGALLSLLGPHVGVGDHDIRELRILDAREEGRLHDDLEAVDDPSTFYVEIMIVAPKVFSCREIEGHLLSQAESPGLEERPDHPDFGIMIPEHSEHEIVFNGINPLEFTRILGLVFVERNPRLSP